jgi:hypothetical protein
MFPFSLKKKLPEKWDNEIQNFFLSLLSIDTKDLQLSNPAIWKHIAITCSGRKLSIPQIKKNWGEIARKIGLHSNLPKKVSSWIVTSTFFSIVMCTKAKHILWFPKFCRLAYICFFLNWLTCPTSTRTSIGRFKVVRFVWVGNPSRTSFFIVLDVEMSSPMDVQTGTPFGVRKWTSNGWWNKENINERNKIRLD